MRTRFILLGCLVSCVAFAASPLPQGATMRAFGDFTTLDQFDRRLDFLTAMSWEMPRRFGAETDPSGRTLQEYLDEFLLTDAAQKRLTALRAAAAATVGDPSDELAGDVLQPLILAISAEYCRMTALQDYWMRVIIIPPFRSDLQAQVLRLPPEHRPAIQARLDQVDEGSRIPRPSSDLLAEECNLPRAPSREQELQDMEGQLRMTDEYNVVRRELAESITRLITAGTIAPESFARTTPCPPAPAGMTGGAKVSVRRVGAIDDYFPARARDLGISGVVRVRMEYDSTGCVTRAVVLETAASPDLDRAAANFALDMEFTPAAVDGKPVGGGVIQRLNFRFLNEP